MKIYNEITIDMNPESGRYEDVLSEDSYEYSGPLMRLDDTEGEGGGDEETTDNTWSGNAWLQEWFSTRGYMPSEYATDYTGENSVGDYATMKSWYSAAGRYGTGGDTTNAYTADGNAHEWHSNDEGGYVDNYQKADEVDPYSGIRIRVYQIQTKGSWLEQMKNAGTLIRFDYPDGTVRYKREAQKDGFSTSWNSNFIQNFKDASQARGRPEWGGRTYAQLQTDFNNWTTQGGDPQDFLNPDVEDPVEDEKKEAERIRLDVQKELAHAKQETEDVAEQSKLQAQKAVARQSGATQRRLQAQLAAQSGMSPEETSALLAGGQEALGRMQGDIIQQSNLMKNKTLSDLAQFDVTAGLSAAELGTKLREIQSNRSQYMAGLKNQFNIAGLQADASMYGADMGYKGALRQAEATETAAYYGMWGDVAQGVGSAIGGV